VADQNLEEGCRSFPFHLVDIVRGKHAIGSRIGRANYRIAGAPGEALPERAQQTLKLARLVSVQSGVDGSRLLGCPKAEVIFPGLRRKRNPFRAPEDFAGMQSHLANELGRPCPGEIAEGNGFQSLVLSFELLGHRRIW
jgi:hypothetical protein